MNTKLLLLASGLILLGGASIATAQHARRDPAQRESIQDGRRDGHGRRQRRRIRRHQRRGEIGRALGVTEQQREMGREAAKALQPIVKDIGPSVRDVRERARELARSGDREGARELMRNELKPLIESAQGRAAPIVRPLVQSLTPEQRQKLEAAAARRGIQFDEARFQRRLALFLALRGRTAEGKVR